MDLRLTDGKKCLLCGNMRSAHGGGDYDTSSCMATLRRLLEFVERYRMGLLEKENFEVIVKIRGGKVVALGPVGGVFRTKL